MTSNAEYKREYKDMLQWYWHHAWILGMLRYQYKDFADEPT